MREMKCPLRALLWICLPSIVAMGMVGASFGQTLSGFITNVDNSRSFELGTVRIVLNSDTKCDINAVSYAVATERKIQDLVHATIHFSFSTFPTSWNVQHVECNDLGVQIGLLVKVTGKTGAASGLQAQRVSVFRIRDGRILGKTQPSGRLSGGAVLEEMPRMDSSSHKWSGNIWMDGYPVNVTTQTHLRSAPVGSQMAFGYFGPPGSGPIFGIKPTGNCFIRNPSAGLLRQGTSVIYKAARKSDGQIAATYICLWGDHMAASARQEITFPVELPDYVLKSPGFIKLHRHGHLEIVPDLVLQKYVSEIGADLVPKYAQVASGVDSSVPNFRFFVIRQSEPALRYAAILSKGWTYGITRPAFDDAAIAMPDGLIAIPDSTLVRLSSRGQLAAVLSFGITQVLQRQFLVTYRSRQYFGGIYNLPSGPYADILARDEQALRIGIRQMYLAGYDIREAPFAWAVAQGKPVNNPVINSKHPDKEIPWYAAYAFNYISQYYKDVDYSKLKRGRREYQQFLQELRKTDPEAFEQAKPQSGSKHK